MKVLLPLVSRWVDAQQRHALPQGVALNALQRLDATRAGVRDPARIRVLVVPEIPAVSRGWTGLVARLFRPLTRDTVGITFGSAILIRRGHERDRALLIHELAHAAQYERFGGTRGFLAAYLEECLRVGYPHGPLEQEAAAVAARISCES